MIGYLPYESDNNPDIIAPTVYPINKDDARSAPSYSVIYQSFWSIGMKNTITKIFPAS